MEEIDIIELLQRVKEGNAPKEIEINGSIYQFDVSYKPDEDSLIDYMYICADINTNKCYLIREENITFKTKIKILDKPIIEELKPVKYENIVTYPDRDILTKKINEIIRVINEKN